MRTLYKTRQRHGRNIEVCYNYDPTKWISTGTKDKEQALIFISKNLSKTDKENKITFSQFLISQILATFEELKLYDYKHGKEKKANYYSNLTSLTKSYIIPAFGSLIISKTTQSILQARLEKASNNNLTRNRIIQALKEIYKLAIINNITDKNQAKELELYKHENKTIDIFTSEELEKLFNHGNFSDDRWELYFKILRDTGWRPSEVASLKYTDIREDGGVSTTASVVYDGTKASYQNKIKTTDKGQSYKIGLLRKDTLKLFQCLNKKTQDFIFIFNGKLLLTQMANRELLKASKKANINLNGRTQYSFRHTFNTRNYYILDKDTRLELMGHTHERKEYLHLKAEERLDNLLSNEKILNILGA